MYLRGSVPGNYPPVGRPRATEHRRWVTSPCRIHWAWWGGGDGSLVHSTFPLVLFRRVWKGDSVSSRLGRTDIASTGGAKETDSLLPRWDILTVRTKYHAMRSTSICERRPLEEANVRRKG